jgi:uncharacterized ferritin-like protein (DUF455 family)
MNDIALPALDPALFASGPTREARFTVVDHWSECSNFPKGHPEKEIEFFHRQMHEELCSVENAARNLADFPDANWEVRMCIARQCSDEARHVLMFRRLCEKRGGSVGRWPVMNFQYRICTNINSLIGRLAVQNRTFEAGGIDAVTVAAQDARERGDLELASLYEMQGADEIQHVRFANDWIRAETRKDPRMILRMAGALHAGAEAFRQVMGEEAVQVEYGADSSGRREAGFDEEEVRVAAEEGDVRLAAVARRTASEAA